MCPLSLLIGDTPSRHCVKLSLSKHHPKQACQSPPRMMILGPMMVHGSRRRSTTSNMPATINLRAAFSLLFLLSLWTGSIGAMQLQVQQQAKSQQAHLHHLPLALPPPQPQQAQHQPPDSRLDLAMMGPVTTTNQQANVLLGNDEVEDREEQGEQMDEMLDTAPLPTCLDDQSVCGYVQVNPFGINKVAICRCPSEGSAGRGGGRVDCPLDMKMDSSTVRHGNDLYKYCKRKPRLSPCKPGQIAYTTFGESDQETGGTLMDVQRVQCQCPADHLLVSNNKPMFKMLDTSFIFGTEMLCKKPPRCTRSQACMSITETEENTLEKRHCSCSPGKHCSRDLRRAFSKEQLGKGTIYRMKCTTGSSLH